MSARATQATPQDAPAPHGPDAHAADAPCYRQALHKLISMGTDLATLLHGQAVAHAAQPAPQPPAPAPPADAPQATPPAPSAPAPHPAPSQAPAALVTIAAAFDQVARAVRRCILLAQALDRPAPPLPDHARERTAARKRIIRAVEDVIQRPRYGSGHDPDGPAADALRAELHERLDAPDLDDDISSRPVAEIIEEITRDLGLDRMPGTRPFGRRTPADVARLCAQAAAPSGSRPLGPMPQGPAPHGAAPRPPGPAEGRDPRPAEPAAGVHPGPVHPGRALPDDPAEAVAFVLRHHAQAKARWHPPPEG